MNAASSADIRSAAIVYCVGSLVPIETEVDAVGQDRGCRYHNNGGDLDIRPQPARGAYLGGSSPPPAPRHRCHRHGVTRSRRPGQSRRAGGYGSQGGPGRSGSPGLIAGSSARTPTTRTSAACPTRRQRPDHHLVTIRGIDHLLYRAACSSTDSSSALSKASSVRTDPLLQQDDRGPGRRTVGNIREDRDLWPSAVRPGPDHYGRRLEQSTTLTRRDRACSASGSDLDDAGGAVDQDRGARRHVGELGDCHDARDAQLARDDRGMAGRSRRAWSSAR